MSDDGVHKEAKLLVVEYAVRRAIMLNGRGVACRRAVAWPAACDNGRGVARLPSRRGHATAASGRLLHARVKTKNETHHTGTHPKRRIDRYFAV